MSVVQYPLATESANCVRKLQGAASDPRAEADGVLCSLAPFVHVAAERGLAALSLLSEGLLPDLQQLRADALALSQLASSVAGFASVAALSARKNNSVALELEWADVMVAGAQVTAACCALVLCMRELTSRVLHFQFAVEAMAFDAQDEAVLVSGYNKLASAVLRFDAFQMSIRENGAGWWDVKLAQGRAGLLSDVRVTAFRQCQLAAFTACSAMSGEGTKMECASWVEADKTEGEGARLLHVSGFVLLERRGVAASAVVDAMLLTCAVALGNCGDLDTVDSRDAAVTGVLLLRLWVPFAQARGAGAVVESELYYGDGGVALDSES